MSGNEIQFESNAKIEQIDHHAGRSRYGTVIRSNYWYETEKRTYIDVLWDGDEQIGVVGIPISPSTRYTVKQIA